MGKLLFLGDFYYNYEYINDDIREISQWIRNNGFSVILNLEGPLSSNGKPVKKRGPNIHQSSTAIEVLKELNVIGVLLANNHIMDYGSKGLADTLKILDDNGIKHTGAGLNLEAALEPIIITIDEKQVIIMNYGWDIEETIYASESSPGCAPRSEALILGSTKKIRSQNPDSIIINTYHWGFEYNIYPMPLDIDLAHKSIDCGCDFIFGSHSHNIQSKEIYNDREIYYSLGNFYFGTKRSSFKKRKFNYEVSNMCDIGAMISVDISSQKSEVYYIEYNQEIGKSIIMNNNTQYGFMTDISGIDFNKAPYQKKVKQNSINVNPILTNNRYKNELKLLGLKVIYKLAAIKKLGRRLLNNNQRV